VALVGSTFMNLSAAPVRDVWSGSGSQSGGKTPPLATSLLLLLSGAKFLVHLLLGGRYGYFRDELYFLDCGRHLAWGYVDHAPMIGLVSRIALALGGSLHVLRLFPAIAGALVVVLTMAGLAVLVVPIYLGIDSILSMNCFEPLFWMGCVYVLIRIIQTGNSRLWVWFGVIAGLGLMNKHSTLFFGFAIVVSMLLTAERKEFFKPWIWTGGVIAVLIFLPNVTWQVQHNFPTLEDLHNVQASGKNVVLSPAAFIGQQIMLMHPILFPIWLAGLWFFLMERSMKYRQRIRCCWQVEQWPLRIGSADHG